ncbi:MAG TPA: DNA/RNA non-specific endonuclease [Pyrinomonadaceae bacterium]|jgi:endonuclease G|nr:DNA/RNA non-specific endonuclease [Pyrinomonadaceae bacterium]
MFKKYSRKIAFIFVFFSVLFSQSFYLGTMPVAHADTVAQAIPFSNNWSTTSQITVLNDWSGVPGIIGYRGDDVNTTIGVDPQTVVVDGSTSPVQVNPNSNDQAGAPTTPTTAVSGGIYEFDNLANPVIAMQGSATADIPHIVISINTSGTTALHISYNLRDLDDTDVATQPFALQYRIGNTGNYTNIPAGFVADASNDSSSTLVTPVSVNLPAAVENHPLVQLRILTCNVIGSDAMIGIDDISVTGTGGGMVNLGGSGSASPSVVAPGNASLLTVHVTPANTPPSTGIAVTTDLSSVGGSAAQAFFDNGSNGDVMAGDNIFSLSYTVPMGTLGGSYNLPSLITDAQKRSAVTSIPLGVDAPVDPAQHLVMGNPSGATTDINNPTNYLLSKSQFVMSYHRDRGIPNWVAWHLDTTWLGSTPRQDDFRPDTTLPAGWYQVLNTDYSGSGFDRGHHCPSGDRTSSIPDNSATFVMTNMMPQAPDNNQGPWEELESYGRTLVNAGNELYIYAGGAGQGGVGSNGAANTVASGHVVVPAFTWKVIVVMPNGDNDADRVGKTTRVIAVIMPNTQGIRTNSWQIYRTNVRQVERLTGLNFFTGIRPQMRFQLKNRIDQQ